MMINIWLIVPVTWSQSAAVPAPQQKMLGARLCIFSQFLSPTMLPPVALVSAANTTPSYIAHSGINHHANQIKVKVSMSMCELLYLENSTTDGSTSLHSSWGLGDSTLSQGFVSDTVVVVKSTQGKSLSIILHH